MPIEIERKYLVTSDAWRRDAGPGRRFCQGYIAREAQGQVRIRRAADQAFVTIKGRRSGIARAEYEYPIPVEEAEEMLKTLCLKPLIEKTRYLVTVAGALWEVDVFCGVPAETGPGELVLAEIEMQNADQALVLPEWVGREVTGDPRFGNAQLAASQRRAEGLVVSP